MLPTPANRWFKSHVDQWLEEAVRAQTTGRFSRDGFSARNPMIWSSDHSGLSRVEFFIEGLAGAEEVTGREAGAGDQVAELWTSRRRFQVFDDSGSIPPLAQEAEDTPAIPAKHLASCGPPAGFGFVLCS
jgi:hypothetical protein